MILTRVRDNMHQYILTPEEDRESGSEFLDQIRILFSAEVATRNAEWEREYLDEGAIKGDIFYEKDLPIRQTFFEIDSSVTVNKEITNQLLIEIKKRIKTLNM